MLQDCSNKLCCGTPQASIHLVLSISPVLKIVVTPQRKGKRKGQSKGHWKSDAQDGGKTTATKQAVPLATM